MILVRGRARIAFRPWGRGPEQSPELLLGVSEKGDPLGVLELLHGGYGHVGPLLLSRGSVRKEPATLAASFLDLAGPLTQRQQAEVFLVRRSHLGPVGPAKCLSYLGQRLVGRVRM